ncbi:hypothetical protein [Paenarthrobacter sp. A20]|uniref:hypothetical protein n=1 Tax=Paenarthrobacter sp. A20 TaxID=2817891 RepID=UPI00209FAA69|nr:hypothetical protein [Paenarthrobacter sp. A20]MCP1414424.1 hypothetical protein [Paenarthrobacter sp. A20]
MDVTLTIEDANGERGSVSAAGRDYAAAYEAARELIPEGCKAIVIRTKESS